MSTPAASTRPITPATTAPLTSGSGGPEPLSTAIAIRHTMNGCEMARPYATRVASPSPIASRSVALSAWFIDDRSVEVAEVAGQAHEEAPEPVHDRMVAGVDEHIGLAADPHGLQALAFGRIEFDRHREALCLAQPVAVVLDLGQRAGLWLLAGADAAAEAAHATFQHLAGHDVE